MNPIPVLMYHAIFEENDDSLMGADKHYAIGLHQFVQHIEYLKSIDYTVTSLNAYLKKRISGQIRMKDMAIFTFDDGHLSNYTLAFPALQKMNCSADFFINSSMVEDKNFIPWNALKEMADHGQSIQSHGHEHKYFDEMSDKEVRYQLETSKKLIEDNIGYEVMIFAPPGGRLGPTTWPIAQELGYKAISSSRPGIWKKKNHYDNIPRFAILQKTSQEQFKCWVNADAKELLRQSFRYNTTYYAKKILGNKNYEKVRKRLLTH